MRKTVLFILILLTAHLTPAFAGEKPSSHADPEGLIELRQEFDGLFKDVKIYQVIRSHLPATYEDLFHSFVEAKRSHDIQEFQGRVAGFVNSIRNSHLKNSSDAAILEFYQHITRTGRDLFRKDPDAAFSYIFGGNPDQYVEYIDYSQELNSLAEIFDHLLASSTQGQAKKIDQAEAEVGINLVFMGLYNNHGDAIKLLNHPEISKLSENERDALCDVYLAMYEGILGLESPTRDNVLRSMALNM